MIDIINIKNAKYLKFYVENELIYCVDMVTDERIIVGEVEEGESDEQMAYEESIEQLKSLIEHFNNGGNDFNATDIEAIKYLLKENEELKKQLEEKKNKYIKRFEKLLAEDIEPDPEDFYLAEIEGKSNDYDKLLNQQKEFIKYLEKTLNEYKEQENKDIQARVIWQRFENLVNEILQKYKKMIGDDK